MAALLGISQAGRLPRRWAKALDGPHRVVGVVAELHEARRLLAELRPELVLLDLDRPRDECLRLCREIVARVDELALPTPVVVLASVLDDEERSAFLRAGATGYVLKTIDAESIAVALEAIAEVAGSAQAGAIGTDPVGLAAVGSRADFLRWSAAATAVAMLVPGRSKAIETNPSPSAAHDLPELPPKADGESDILRMQRELLRAMAKPVDERKWVMVIDLRKCSGCDACTIACKAENQLPPGVVYRPVVQEEIGTYPNVRRRFLPRPCMQCESPPCTPVCPVGATWRRTDGVIAIDYERCIGCRYCLTACPYSARTTDLGEFYTDDTPARQPYEEQVSPEYNAGFRRSDGGSPMHNARKCHFCLHRLEAGQLPACVTTCIGHATYFGDANDPESLVAELIGLPEARRLKEELGTKPRVYYLT
jgi:molybdopterin-containing oxidoreductase family iron-sulfur binding subunit